MVNEQEEKDPQNRHKSERPTCSHSQESKSCHIYIHRGPGGGGACF